MSVRFSMRFNLYNDPSRLPATAQLIAEALKADPAEVQYHLDDFERIQLDRIERLKRECAQAVTVLEGTKTVFVGDSITNDNLGYRLSVTRAASLCAADASVSGGSSRSVLDGSLAAISSHRPALVSVMLGANDSKLHGETNLVGIQEYEKNIRAIIECALSARARVLLFEITPVHEEWFAKSFGPRGMSQSNSMIKGYNALLQELANEYGISLASNAWILTQDGIMWEPDGIHLSIAAHELFAKNWLAEAAKIINK